MFYEIHRENTDLIDTIVGIIANTIGGEADQTNPEDTTRFLRNLFRYSGKEEWKWWKHHFQEIGINVIGFLSDPYEERSPFSHMGNITGNLTTEVIGDENVIEIVADFDNEGCAGEAHYFFKAIYDDFEEGGELIWDVILDHVKINWY